MFIAQQHLLLLSSSRSPQNIKKPQIPWSFNLKRFLVANTPRFKVQKNVSLQNVSPRPFWLSSKYFKMYSNLSLMVKNHPPQHLVVSCTKFWQVLSLLAPTFTLPPKKLGPPSADTFPPQLHRRPVEPVQRFLWRGNSLSQGWLSAFSSAAFSSSAFSSLAISSSAFSSSAFSSLTFSSSAFLIVGILIIAMTIHGLSGRVQDLSRVLKNSGNPSRQGLRKKHKKSVKTSSKNIATQT